LNYYDVNLYCATN